MNVPWALRVLLAIVTFTVPSKGTVEIENRIRLITPDDDMGGGRVEVYHNNQWGTICDENWSNEAAGVVCKELGYSGALFRTKKAYYGEGTNHTIHMTNVQCDGSERSILECKHNGWGVTGSCTHKDDAGVICLNEDTPDMKYLGCWIDNPGKRILTDFYSNRRVGINWQNLGETVLNCAKDAVTSGKDYNLFAVQFYGECFSQEGNPLYKKMMAAPHACVHGVGELSHNAVYGFAPYYNLGCWADKPRKQRTMTLLKNIRKKIDWFDMGKTVTACYSLAKDAGKKYFAVQFYGECWVSDDEKFREYGQATNCWKGVGAHWSNYVYKVRV
ncbi:Lysyl oxidase-like 4 [Desmophyllum pertusum]|uniref:Lysyl oxidase-like 4 n=1 Tax=Desmophyllum pertusum TaxID=174260 RepID=A0A9W9YA46_9CNID|nr:Lysyl oxidase-like 4 [Desmophyllum pertusum]